MPVVIQQALRLKATGAVSVRFANPRLLSRRCHLPAGALEALASWTGGNSVTSPIQRSPMAILVGDSNAPEFIFGGPVVLNMDKNR